MCSIIGVGERLHKVLGQIDLGTLDSGERSLLLSYLFPIPYPALFTHVRSRVMRRRVTICSRFSDILNSFLDIHNSFLISNNIFCDITNYFWISKNPIFFLNFGYL